jgi:DNA-directed RNA polymerase subunit RPC12/RpoP
MDLKFYFCEACGKRLTNIDLEAGQAKDKKLKGVFCKACSVGVMTMDMPAIRDEDLKNASAKASVEPVVRESSIIRKVPQKSVEPAVRESSIIRKLPQKSVERTVKPAQTNARMTVAIGLAAASAVIVVAIGFAFTKSPAPLAKAPVVRIPTPAPKAPAPVAPVKPPSPTPEPGEQSATEDPGTTPGVPAALTEPEPPVQQPVPAEKTPVTTAPEKLEPAPVAPATSELPPATEKVEAAPTPATPTPPAITDAAAGTERPALPAVTPATITPRQGVPLSVNDQIRNALSGEILKTGDDRYVEVKYDFSKNPQCAKDFGGTAISHADGLLLKAGSKDRDYNYPSARYKPIFQTKALRIELVLTSSRHDIEVVRVGDLHVKMRWIGAGQVLVGKGPPDPLKGKPFKHPSENGTYRYLFERTAGQVRAMLENVEILKEAPPAASLTEKLWAVALATNGDCTIKEMTVQGFLDDDWLKAQTVPLPPAPGVTADTKLAPGLIGSYYRGEEFKDADFVLSRIDSNVLMNTQTLAPASGVPAKKHCIRWMGYLKVEKPGKYTIYAYLNDGGRLWLDGKLLIDKWVKCNDATHPTPPGAELELAPGMHSIRLDYVSRYWNSVVLYWALKDSFIREIIPSESFVHDAAAEQAARVPVTDFKVSLVKYNGKAAEPHIEPAGSANSFHAGCLMHNDRTGRWVTVPPELDWQLRLFTPLNDKGISSTDSKYVISVSAPCSVYVVIDPRHKGTKYPWMDDSWSETALACRDDSLTADWKIYKKDLPSAGDLTLGCETGFSFAGPNFVIVPKKK